MDMEKCIEKADDNIDFLLDNSDVEDRKGVLVRCQAITYSSRDEVRDYAHENGYQPGGKHIVEWLIENYKWPVLDDPVPGWKGRLASLKCEKNKHLALKKYCNFMKQTEEIREMLEEQAYRLDAHIQLLVDQARGK